MDVIVAEPGTPNFELAVKHGFKPVSAAEAAKGPGDPDPDPGPRPGQLYKNDLKPQMTKGKTLVFSHGFNIHFGQIVPGPEVDVIMVAPKGPGHLVRSEYEKGGGVPA